MEATTEALALGNQSQDGSGRPSELQHSHAPGQETTLGDVLEGSQEAVDQPVAQPVQSAGIPLPSLRRPTRVKKAPDRLDW